MSARITGALARTLPALAVALALSLTYGCDASIKGPEVSSYLDYRPDLVVAVYDDSGTRLAGAAVNLYRQTAAGMVLYGVTESDEGGEATFVEPNQGAYLVFASKSGYVGSSTWVIVEERSVMVNDVRLTSLSNLADRAAATIDSDGGPMSTRSVPGFTQSTLTFPPGVLSDGSSVTLATLSGQQIPFVPQGLGAVTVLRVDIQGQVTGGAKVDMGLPFTLPAGTVVPVHIYDPSNGSWSQVSTGTVQASKIARAGAEGIVLGLVDLIYFRPNQETILAALGNQSISLSEDVQKTEIFPPGDQAEIVLTFTPLLEFPAGTGYSEPERQWIRSSLEHFLALTFGEEITRRVLRDVSATHRVFTLRHVDRYTLTQSFSGMRPSRTVAKVAVAARQFFGDTETKSATIQVIGHDSGAGGGG